MRFSESITDLAIALAAAQRELKNPYNTADNPFFKSKYAPLPDVLNEIRPVLAKYGLSLIQSPAVSEKGIGVETLLLHKSGQHIAFDPYFLTPAKNDPQTAGGAITYARRYALNAILGIAGEEDDDGNTASGNSTKKPPRKSEIASAESAPPPPWTQNHTPAPSIKCPKCGKIVQAHPRKGGGDIFPEEIIEKFGMCVPCYNSKNEQGNDN